MFNVISAVVLWIAVFVQIAYLTSFSQLAGLLPTVALLWTPMLKACESWEKNKNRIWDKIFPYDPLLAEVTPILMVPALIFSLCTVFSYAGTDMSFQWTGLEILGVVYTVVAIVYGFGWLCWNG